MRFRALFVAGLAAGMVGAAPAAAEDQRPCVSKREYYSVNGLVPQVRSNMERRWDVVGRGVRLRHLEGPKTYTVRYIACGYGPRDGGVIIQYRKGDDSERRSKRNIERGVTSHGHV